MGALVSLTPAQRNAFVRYRNDVRERNEAGVRRWRRERKALRDSNLRNLTLVVTR
jgi:hypothetical protein